METQTEGGSFHLIKPHLYTKFPQQFKYNKSKNKSVRGEYWKVALN